MGVKSMQSPELGNEELRADIFPITSETILSLADEDARVARDRKLRNAPTEQSGEYQYVVGAQDVLRVTVWDHPELNNPGAITGTPSLVEAGLSTTSTTILGTAATDSTSRVVADDGTMFFPYVGVIKVSGKTPEQVRAFLTKELSKTIRNPQVEVVVASYRSKRAYVTGEVKAPGVLPVTDIPLLVTDAIGASGGLNSDADLGGVTLTRAGKVIPLDLYALLYQGDINQNIRLRAGDLLYVPEQRYNKVFVLGEVVKPASIPMPRGQYTLNEALSDAGGASQLTAKASQIYVIRGSQDRPQVYHLDASRPDALILADRFNLKPRDIVFVDAAEIVRYNRVISQILPALQALQAGKYLGQ